MFGVGKTDWNKLTETQKKNFVMVMLDKYEVVHKMPILQQMYVYGGGGGGGGRNNRWGQYLLVLFS